MRRNIPANVRRELGNGALLGMSPAADIQERQDETSTARGQGSLETPQAEKLEDLKISSPRSMSPFGSFNSAKAVVSASTSFFLAASQRQSARAARTKISLCLSVQARLNVYERRSAVARSAS